MASSGKARPHGSAEAQRATPHTRLDDEAAVRVEYEFGKKLGQGTFGLVLEATSQKDGSKWAVKIISKDIKEKDRSTAFKLLEREVAILKQVQHEHIIHLEEVFETPKKLYLIMELCEGGELADALKEKKKYSEDETKVIISKLARAIQYMHKRDIVHRDLKLENILLTHNPDDPEDHLHIKVTDFGLSVVKDGTGYDSMMQAVCGTPVYMSPEIIDNKTYSQQCDVWAMGIIMYTLLCGNPPFMAEDEDKLYDLIKRGNINFPDNSFKHITEEAKKCIRGMLKVDPAHRYTASEVLEHSWISGREMKAGHMNVLEMMKQWNTLNLDSESLESCAIVDHELMMAPTAPAPATSTGAAAGAATSSGARSEEGEPEGGEERVVNGVNSGAGSGSPVQDQVSKAGSSQENHKVSPNVDSKPATKASTSAARSLKKPNATTGPPASSSPLTNRKAPTPSPKTPPTTTVRGKKK